jgi:hypothetical protein
MNPPPAAIVDAAYLAHRIILEEDGSIHYPLHHLARWCAAVDRHEGTLTDVKRAMIAAKARIAVECTRGGVPLDAHYRKIGTTVCVTEDASAWSVDAWRAHPTAEGNRALQSFAEHIAHVQRAIFHEQQEQMAGMAAEPAEVAAEEAAGDAPSSAPSMESTPIVQPEPEATIVPAPVSIAAALIAASPVASPQAATAGGNEGAE